MRARWQSPQRLYVNIKFGYTLNNGFAVSAETDRKSERFASVCESLPN